MKRLIEFPLEEGGSIVVEVDEPTPEGGVVRAARPGEIAAKAGQTFEAALERIKPVAGTIIAKLRGLHDPPDEAVVEFGLKMSGQAGSVVVASVGAEAHYKVTLTWRREEVTKVAFAVDSCQAAFKRAVATEAQLLIVHHGLFWDKPLRLVGPLFRRVKTLIEGGCGLYAAHLPLDLHPEVGNNAELARLLGLKDTRTFGEHHGNQIGIGGVLDPPTPLDVLVERLTRATGESPVRVLAHGPTEASQVGCISGGAAFLMDQIAGAGFDTFVTGETSHTFFHQAAEWGLNVLYGGHYATETLGLKALARHLEEKFGLETTFLDIPTGM